MRGSMNVQDLQCEAVNREILFALAPQSPLAIAGLWRITSAMSIVDEPLLP